MLYILFDQSELKETFNIKMYWVFACKQKALKLQSAALFRACVCFTLTDIFGKDTLFYSFFFLMNKENILKLTTSFTLLFAPECVAKIHPLTIPSL